jgi:hypothetical protein
MLLHLYAVEFMVWFASSLTSRLAFGFTGRNKEVGYTHAAGATAGDCCV